MANAVGGEHFFQNLSNSRLDWRVNYARATRDEPDLRETLYERALDAGGHERNGQSVHLRRRVAERLPDVQQARTTTRRTLPSTGRCFNTSGGRPTQYKFGVNYVDRDARLPVAPLPLHSDHDAEGRRRATCSSTTGSRPRSSSSPSNIGTAFRFNEETRPTDAYDGDQTTTSGYGMVDIAMTRAHAAHRRRARRAVRSDRHDAGSVRSVRARSAGDEQEHRLLPGGQLRAGRRRELEHSPELQHDGQPARVPRAGRVRVHRRRRQPRGEGQRESAARADSERRRPVGDVQRRPRASWRPASSTSTSTSRSSASSSPRPTRSPRSRTPTTPGTSASSSRRAHQLGEHFFLNANYTFVDSKITLLPEQLGVQTSSERPLAGQSKNLFNLTGEFAMSGFSTRLLFNYFGDRISDVGANEAPDIIEQGRGSLDLVFAQRISGLGIRLTLENLTDSDYLFTQTLTHAGDAAAVQAGPDGRAVVRLQRVLRPTMTNTKEHTRNHAGITRRIFGLAAGGRPGRCVAVTKTVRRPGAAGERPGHRQAGHRRHRVQSPAPRPGPAPTTTCCAARCSFEQGATLNIEAGTRIIGESGSVGTLIVSRGGRLNAIGTADSADRLHERPADRSAGPGRLGRHHHQRPRPDQLRQRRGRRRRRHRRLRRHRRQRQQRHPALRPRRVLGRRVQPGQRAERHRVPGRRPRHAGRSRPGAHEPRRRAGVVRRHRRTASTPSRPTPPTTASTGRSAGPGALQFVAVTQRGDDADNGIEADNNEFNNNALPRSNPQIYNITHVRRSGPQRGRRESARREPAPRHGVHDPQLPDHRVQDRRSPDRDDQHGDDRAGRQRHVADGRRRRLEHRRDRRRRRHGDARQRRDLREQRPLSRTCGRTWIPASRRPAAPIMQRPNFQPSGIATLAGGQLAPIQPPNDGFFEAVTFIGAVPPAPAANWMDGWTSFPQN